MTKANYIGEELFLFKEAKNWKNYWYQSVKDYIQGNVLEVGAGIGINTNLFLQKGNSIKSLIALEPDENLSKHILKNVSTEKSKVIVQSCTLAEFEVHQKFDTILYIDVLEHINQDAEELQRAKSLLKTGGHLIILVPAHQFLFSPFDSAIGHFRRYNKKTLKKSIPSHLFQIKLFYLDSMGIMSSLLNKWFLKQNYPTLNQVNKWDSLIVPSSKFTDKLFFYSLGKTLIGIWKKY